MDVEHWQEFVDHEIPIIQQSQFKIVEIKPGFSLVKGTFRDHRNNRGSVYGGSIASIATLCAWLAVKSLIQDINPEAEVALSHSRLDFTEGLTRDFYARSQDILVKDVVKMKNSLQKKGVGTIPVTVELFSEPGQVMAVFVGEFRVVK